MNRFNLSQIENIPEVKNALDYSKRFLTSVARRREENYAQHGIRVFKTLKEISNDPSLYSICFLHDLLVHPNGQKLLKKAPLTNLEKNIVKKLYHLRNLSIDSNIKDLNRAISYFSTDYRILLIRMAHRLSDIRRIESFENKKISKKNARETLHMYSPLAGRLGLHKWHHEMEDICFKYLFPKIARKLEKKFAFYKKSDKECLHHTGEFIKHELTKNNIECRLEYRIKTIYSTYKKMVSKNRKFEEITDRLAIRIITKTKDECYLSLGVIHSIMHPIPGRLKDYIGAPKENGYQSIHTVVFPLPKMANRPIEIQIRSDEIHEKCELGIASHFYYKKNSYYMRYDTKTKASLLKSLEIIKHEAAGIKKFSHILQHYFDSNQVIVYDSRNKIYHLNKPASILDFVCIYYKKRVKYLKSVKINGIISSFDTILEDGDVIEVQFQKKKSFSKNWVKMCHHKRARNLLSEIS